MDLIKERSTGSTNRRQKLTYVEVLLKSTNLEMRAMAKLIYVEVLLESTNLEMGAICWK